MSNMLLGSSVNDSLACNVCAVINTGAGQAVMETLTNRNSAGMFH